MPEVVLVAIDRATQNYAQQTVSRYSRRKIGKFAGGNIEPFREIHARLVEQLITLRPKLIVLNVMFGASTGAASDALASALDAAEKAGIRTVVAVDLDGRRGHKGIYGKRPVGHVGLDYRVEKSGPSVGTIYARTEPGLSRTAPNGKPYPVEPLCVAAYAALVGNRQAAAAKAEQIGEEWPTAAKNGQLTRVIKVVPARTRQGDRRKPISAASLLQGRKEARVGGSVVVIGFDLPELDFDRQPLLPDGPKIASVWAHVWGLRALIDPPRLGAHLPGVHGHAMRRRLA